MSVVNVLFGTKRMRMNLDDEFRFSKENIGYILKHFGVSPVEFTRRPNIVIQKIADDGVAVLGTFDLAKSMNAQGWHIDALGYTMVELPGPGFPKFPQSIRLVDTDDAGFPSLATYPPSNLIPVVIF